MLIPTTWLLANLLIICKSRVSIRQDRHYPHVALLRCMFLQSEQIGIETQIFWDPTADIPRHKLPNRFSHVTFHNSYFRSTLSLVFEIRIRRQVLKVDFVWRK